LAGNFLRRCLLHIKYYISFLKDVRLIFLMIPLLLSPVYLDSSAEIVAGRFISFVFGLLTVFPVYFFAKDVFGEKNGSITATLFAFHPFVCKYPARVLPEATYIFFFACSVWLCWKAISMQKYSLFLLGGLDSAKPLWIVAREAIVHFKLVPEKYQRKNIPICYIMK